MESMTKMLAPHGCQHCVDNLLQATKAIQDALHYTVAGTVGMEHFQHAVQRKMQSTVYPVPPQPTMPNREQA